MLGLFENMSYFLCPHCGGRAESSPMAARRRRPRRNGVRFLGASPLDIEIREASDAGTPVVAGSPEFNQAKPYFDLAHAVLDELAKAGRRAPVFSIG